jgi:hypothetical protein
MVYPPPGGELFGAAWRPCRRWPFGGSSSSGKFSQKRLWICSRPSTVGKLAELGGRLRIAFSLNHCVRTIYITPCLPEPMTTERKCLLRPPGKFEHNAHPQSAISMAMHLRLCAPTATRSLAKASPCRDGPRLVGATTTYRPAIPAPPGNDGVLPPIPPGASPQSPHFPKYFEAPLPPLSL